MATQYADDIVFVTGNRRRRGVVNIGAICGGDTYWAMLLGVEDGSTTQSRASLVTPPLNEEIFGA